MFVNEEARFSVETGLEKGVACVEFPEKGVFNLI